MTGNLTDEKRTWIIKEYRKINNAKNIYYKLKEKYTKHSPTRHEYLAEENSFIKHRKRASLELEIVRLWVI